MTRRVEIVIAVEVEKIEPGVPVFRCSGYGAAELYVFRGDDGRWRSVTALRGCNGCRLPETFNAGRPPLGAVIERAFPEIAGAP